MSAPDLILSLTILIACGVGSNAAYGRNHRRRIAREWVRYLQESVADAAWSPTTPTVPAAPALPGHPGG